MRLLAVDVPNLKQRLPAARIVEERLVTISSAGASYRQVHAWAKALHGATLLAVFNAANAPNKFNVFAEKSSVSMLNALLEGSLENDVGFGAGSYSRPLMGGDIHSETLPQFEWSFSRFLNERDYEPQDDAEVAEYTDEFADELEHFSHAHNDSNNDDALQLE